MLIIRQAWKEALKLIQVRFQDGWYEDGALVTSSEANGWSDVWLWTVPTKAVLSISGCGGGGGGAGGCNNGASAGAGGGGGGSGLGVQNLVVIVPAGEVIRITVGGGGFGESPGRIPASGGATIIEFSSLKPGEFGTLAMAGGTYGNGARLYLAGGQGGYPGDVGATGFGRGGDGAYPLVSGGLTSGAAGTVSVLVNPPYTRQANGAGAGGNPGAAGGGNDTNIGHYLRNSVGGATADGAGGGGAGGVSIFGQGSNGGDGHTPGVAMTWGYGSGGGGGGGNSAGNDNAGYGASGRWGYVEIIYMEAQ